MFQATTIKETWQVKKDKGIRKYKRYLKDKWHKMLRRGIRKKQYKGEELYW